MSKTLSELSREMRDYIVELQSDAHNVSGVKKYRYNTKTNVLVRRFNYQEFDGIGRRNFRSIRR